MSKRTEAGFVVAIAALTVLSTATALHDRSAGRPDPLAGWLQRGWTAVKGWSEASAHADVVPDAHRPVGQPVLSAEGAAAENGRVAQSGTRTSWANSSWSASDSTRLDRIGTELSERMTPSDWTTVEQALMEDTPQTAAPRLTAILNRVLSPSDVQWLQAQFGGAEPFSPEDVALLQQTFQEVRDNLTPGEQALIAQELQRMGVSVGNWMMSGQ
ncbi:MAG: hypothetical protein K6T78_08825 [Alicyclobacillus sp.]|nr:hypothetical protein [Alicyclobacillus sp.]